MARLFSSVLNCVVFVFCVILFTPTSSKEWQDEKSEYQGNFPSNIGVQTTNDSSIKETESNIEKEMLEIVQNQTDQNGVIPSTWNLAKALVRFLDDKYNTKRWVVAVTNLSSCRSFRLSREFHQVEINETGVAAISVKREDWTDLSLIRRHFLNDFSWPIQSQSANSKPLKNFEEIHTYLDRYLEPIRMVVDTHTLTVNCWRDVYVENHVNVAASSNTSLPIKIISPPLNKVNKLHQILAFIPVMLSASFNSTKSALDFLTQKNQQCRWNLATEASGPLRNPLNNKYLSVEGDSTEDGAYIITDEWKNSSSQRWRFVNNQLRNDNGKCLTVWANLFATLYLYQYDCNNNWSGQIWFQNGLQIVNVYGMCLVQLEDYKEYVVQSQCGFAYDQSQSEHWVNFHTDCFKQINIPKAQHYEGYGLLRMEKLNLYLTASEDNDDVSINPWTNDPGQYWQFDNGKLINFNGKCLIFRDDSWLVKTVTCNQTGKHELTFNWKKQIVYNERYCLVMHQKYHYDNCLDVPKQRWIYVH